MQSRARVVCAALVGVLGACGVVAAAGTSGGGGPFAVAAGPAMFEGPVPRAACGPGSRPETALQGQVPKADRDSGRNREGYSCNLELVGQYQGEGSSWVSQSYRDCAYMSVRFPSAARSPGVQVIDVADPSAPKLAGTLTSPAMLGTWESLKVNEKRGLLAAISAPSPGGNGAAFFDVYDIKDDCRKPKLLNSLPVPGLSLPANVGGHEGEWSPDGRTYWGTFIWAGTITAIDVADPARPRALFTGRTGVFNHGLGVSDDGNRLYMAESGGAASVLGGPADADTRNGLQVFDISEIQARRAAPQMRELGTVTWKDGAFGQHTIPISYGGRPFLVYVDEASAGAARIIDLADETNPRVVSKLKLEIHMPDHRAERQRDTAGTGPFGYEAHYCTADRQADPRALACGYFQSGVRVFDIRDPRRPREVAYFNPPAQVGRERELQSSEHAGNPWLGTGSAGITADSCSSPPRFVGDQLWVTCQDNGFLALRFTNGAWPFAEAGASAQRPRLTLRVRRRGKLLAVSGVVRPRRAGYVIRIERLRGRQATTIATLRLGSSATYRRSLRTSMRPRDRFRAVLVDEAGRRIAASRAVIPAGAGPQPRGRAARSRPRTGHRSRGA